MFVGVYYAGNCVHKRTGGEFDTCVRYVRLAFVHDSHLSVSPDHIIMTFFTLTQRRPPANGLCIKTNMASIVPLEEMPSPPPCAAHFRCPLKVSRTIKLLCSPFC